MQSDRDLLKQALHTLEGWANHGEWVWPESALEQAKRNTTEAITALRERLAREEQEPVACIIDGDLYHHHEIDWEDLAYQGPGVELLYTRPQPAAQWVELTEEDIWAAAANSLDSVLGRLHFARAIEAKLKEKNA